MSRRKWDPGVKAMAKAYELLSPLSRNEQLAALGWLASKLAEDEERRAIQRIEGETRGEG